MANPMNIRVHYDEDESRADGDAITEEVSEAVRGIQGVEDVEVDLVFTNYPHEARIEVLFDETEIDGDELLFEVKTLPFVHNAQQDKRQL